jgi:hypothetical protein
MDREWLNAEIDRVVRDRGTIVRREVQEQLFKRLHERFQDGDKHIERLLLGLAFDGLSSKVDTRIKNEHDMVRASDDGRVLQMPKMQAIRARDDDGKPTGLVQRRLWREFTRREFDAFVVDRERQAAALNERVTIFQAVQRAWDEHPNCTTAGDAAVWAGIDANAVDAAMEQSA